MADEVIAFMHENDSLYGNASSMHTLGRQAAAGIEWARKEVADLIEASADEIYFTSGASESNNSVLNIFRDRIDSGDKRNRIVISSVEHPATIETAKYLTKKGYIIDYCPVDHIGRIKLDELKHLVGENTALVSIMTGNNESGTIQPVKEAAEIAHKAGAFFHTDAFRAGAFQRDGIIRKSAGRAFTGAAAVHHVEKLLCGRVAHAFFMLEDEQLAGAHLAACR